MSRLPRTLDPLLDQQAQVVTRAQALRVGCSRDVIDGLVARGAWQLAFRGVYVVFSGPVPFETRAWAGLLAAGAGAALSYRTAAFLDGLADTPGGVVHASIPISRRVDQRPGLAVRIDTNLARKVQPARLPCRTRLEDTVLDLADGSERLTEVATWVTRACQRRLTTPARLAETLAARKKIAWRPQLEAMLSDVAQGAHSPLELQYLRRVERAHGLPTGERQQRWAGQRVIWIDVDLDEFGTRVELDGRVGHVEEGAFRDRRRDNRGAVDGRTTLRYGHVEVFGEPCAVALQVAAVIGARGWDGRLRRCGRECDVRRGLMIVER